jgi:tripartite-type tricarboxylate transporter receptor subunit TctC
MVMPFGAGGTSDVVGRKFAEVANKYLKKSIVVVQKTGADGAVAATTFTAEPPDTNDILFTSLGQFYASNINKAMTFDMSNVTVTSLLYVTNWILFVRKDSDMTTVDDLIAASKKRILKISGGGVGTDAHLSAGGFFVGIGGRSEPVNYEGGAAQLAALLSKDVDCFVGNANLGLPYVQRGDVIPVICFGNTDFTGYEGIKVPCAENLGYKGHVIGGMGALSVHKGANPAHKAALQELSKKVLADPDWLEWTNGQLLEQRPIYDAELYSFLDLQVQNAVNSAKALGIYTKN